MLTRSLILTAALAAVASSLKAQVIVEQELAKPSAMLKEEFKSVRAVRELRDGRVLLVDGGELRLAIGDFASGKVETRVKVGAEDSEARAFGPLWAWPGDSTMSLDVIKGRMMVFGPDGAVGRMTDGRAAGAAPPAGAPRRPARFPLARYLVGTEEMIGSGNPAPPATRPNPASAPPRTPYAVLRFSLRTMRSDTVVQLMPAQAPRAPLQSRTVGTFTAFVATTPLQSVDVWAAYPDGMVAVVRAASYRIEWFAADGARTSTEPVTFVPIPVTSGDRKRVVDEFKRTADAALQSNPDRTAILAVNYDEPASWPTTHPPFRSDLAPHVDPRDRLWLATRCLKDEQATCYDVIDRLGMRVARYKVAPRTVIVAFGKDVVYTFNESKGQLQRHPLVDAP